MSDDKEILVDDREKNESTENQDQDIHEDVCSIPGLTKKGKDLALLQATA